MHASKPGVGSHLGTVAASPAVADLWFAHVGEHVPDIDRLSRDYLSKDECDRLARYRSREAAERYVVTRSLVREVLSERLGIAAREVPVTRTDTGKPIVAGGLHFNVSHSGDLILLAVSEQRDVGVDVERRRAVERVDALITRWLSGPELEDLARLSSSGSDTSDAFLRVWSAKEARLKALGVGISGAARAGLRDVDVVPLDDLLRNAVSARDARGYVGAVAFA
jgi:4'-phosphopantetheinyl transferase